MDPTEPMIDSQTSSTINTNNSDAVSRTQNNTALSNASVTTSPKDVQNSQNNTTLDGSPHKNDKPADIHDPRLLNVTPGEFLFLFQNVFLSLFSSFTAQLYRTANYSKDRLMSYFDEGFHSSLFFLAPLAVPAGDFFLFRNFVYLFTPPFE